MATGVTIPGRMGVDGIDGGSAPVMMASVLNILDQYAHLPRIDAAKGKGLSKEEPVAATLPEDPTIQVPDAGDDPEVRFRLLRPLLPDDLIPPSLASPRAYEDFIRALEDEKRAVRPNVVDLFE